MIKFFVFDKYKESFKSFEQRVVATLPSLGDISGIDLASNDSGELIIQVDGSEGATATEQDIFLFDCLSMRDVQEIVDSVTKETNANGKTVKSVALTSYRSGRGVYLAVLTVKLRNDLDSITSNKEQEIPETQGGQEGNKDSGPDAKANATGKGSRRRKDKKPDGGGSP